MEKRTDVLRRISNGSPFAPDINKALALYPIGEVRNAIGDALNELINNARRDGYSDIEASYRAKRSELDSGEQFDIFGATVPAMK